MPLEKMATSMLGDPKLLILVGFRVYRVWGLGFKVWVRRQFDSTDGSTGICSLRLWGNLQ